jgi:uncharacterized membrane protein
MSLSSLLSSIGPADAPALCFLALVWLGTGWIVEHPPASLPSVTVLMRGYRLAWMHQMVTRQPRIFDATIMDNLRQGTTFFASACMIAIGGAVALIGNANRLSGFAVGLALEPQPVVVIQIKLIAAAILVTDALLKFVWAHRLFGYCAIVMASVPNDPGDPDAYPRATQAAEINVAAAKNFNKGLRSVYFALAGLGWLAGPVALAAAVTVTGAVLMRREFSSQSRRVLMRETPT